MLSISPCHSDSNARTVPRASPPGKISSTPRWTARTAGRNSWSRHHRISSCLLISSNSSARTAVGSSLRPPNNLGPRCPAPSRTAVNRSRCRSPIGSRSAERANRSGEVHVAALPGMKEGRLQHPTLFTRAACGASPWNGRLSKGRIADRRRSRTSPRASRSFPTASPRVPLGRKG
jgi:hypothetical protein